MEIVADIFPKQTWEFHTIVFGAEYIEGDLFTRRVERSVVVIRASNV